MRVDDRNLTSVPAAESGRTQETQRSGRDNASRPGSETDSGGDHVELSSTLGSLARAMSAYGSDRQSWVNALAAQYQNGTYQPNITATSRGLISEALAAGTQ
jgi:Anti-sigma-28 factor, FlgM